MTIGYIIMVVVMAILGLVLSIHAFGMGNRYGIFSTVVSMIVVFAMIFGGLWYFNNTGKGARALKDQESNLNNGIKREITITAEDGREIYHYSGKCDIETNDGYILFEDENGLRQIIYYGALDTIIISEVGG